MAAIGGKRWSLKLAEAVRRARRLDQPVYVIETARSWDLMDKEPIEFNRGRRYMVVLGSGAFTWKTT